jgi:pimeloyl-ACP methyl ester carboxylesterase
MIIEKIKFTREECKTIKILGTNISYREYGKGRPVLLLHGMAASSYSWKYLIENMPLDGVKYILPDLKGFGYSEKKLDAHFSPFDQSEIVAEFIRKKNLKNLTVIAHSMGGAVAILTLFIKDIEARVRDLVLIDSAGLFLRIPDFVADFADSAEDFVILKYTKSKPDVLPRYILNELYFNPAKIKEDMIEEYAGIFSMPDAKACMFQSLRQLLIANIEDFYTRLQKLNIRTKIIWGEEDSIIRLEDAFHFKNALLYSELSVIPQCGHCPHEEEPEKTAMVIKQFITSDDYEYEESFEKNFEDDIIIKGKRNTNSQLPSFPFRRAEMSRLFKGNWSVASVIFFIFIKILQFIRKLGVFARDNGWRKVTQVFLRKEHSKFCLASFRLEFAEDAGVEKIDFPRAKALVMAKLFTFIKNNSIFHWTLEEHSFSTDKKPNQYVDLVDSEFEKDGKLAAIRPNFETKRESGIFISESQTEKLSDIFCSVYNETLDIDDKKRLKKLTRLLIKKISSNSDSRKEYKILTHYGHRIMQATFITFQTTVNNKTNYLSAERLKTPDFRIIKHPGAGLLNIVCRFSPDLGESDLWFQYHHVPVDGMPMQEMLEKLKLQWGAAGPVIFPPLNSKDAEPEVVFAGDNTYRGRIFCDFSEIMAFRKKLNEKYYAKMIGPAPLPALIVWGLATRKEFEGYKFSIPVDTGGMKAQTKERNISLIFIKPDIYFNKDRNLNGLIDFIRDFNHQIYLTRMGKSESYEFIEIAGMLSPMLTRIVHKVFPQPFNSVIGNAGLTVIKNAEMFITPLTELQKSGFIAMGNGKIPTADGKSCGCVSICGEKELVNSYIEAFEDITTNYQKINCIEN